MALKELPVICAEALTPDAGSSTSSCAVSAAPAPMIQCHQCPALFQRQVDLQAHLVLHQRAENSCERIPVAGQYLPELSDSQQQQWPLQQSACPSLLLSQSTATTDASQQTDVKYNQTNNNNEQSARRSTPAVGVQWRSASPLYCSISSSSSLGDGGGVLNLSSGSSAMRSSSSTDSAANTSMVGGVGSSLYGRMPAATESCELLFTDESLSNSCPSPQLPSSSSSSAATALSSWHQHRHRQSCSSAGQLEVHNQTSSLPHAPPPVDELQVCRYMVDSLPHGLFTFPSLISPADSYQPPPPSATSTSSSTSAAVWMPASLTIPPVAVPPPTSAPPLYKCRFCCRQFASDQQLNAHASAVAEARQSCTTCHELGHVDWHVARHVAEQHCAWNTWRREFAGSVSVDASAAATEPSHARVADDRGSGSAEVLRVPAGSAAVKSVCGQATEPTARVITRPAALFVCALCEAGFSRRSSLLRHFAKKHSESGPPPPPPSSLLLRQQQVQERRQQQRRKKSGVGVGLLRRMCSCDKCGRIFSSQRRLQWHAEIHARRPHTCATCGRRFMHQSWLTRHVRRQHDATYSAQGTGASSAVTCPVCGRAYMRSSLTRHIRMVHERVRPYECSVCSRRFAAKCNLQAHELSHLSAARRPFRCELCGKGYTTQRDLNEHASAHDERRRLACGECGRQFSQRKALNAHMRGHAGRRDHVCDVCGRQFARRAYLTAHARVHTGERPHTCAVCERSFASRSNYNVHVRNHTRRHITNTEL